MHMKTGFFFRDVRVTVDKYKHNTISKGKNNKVIYPFPLTSQIRTTCLCVTHKILIDTMAI